MNTPTLHTLRLDIDGDAVRATLCRPERLNAVGAQLLDELVVLADWLGEREDLHYLVLDHEGPVFSAGANLEEARELLADAGRARARLRANQRAAQQALSKLAALEQISFAALRGSAYGAGVAIAMACDFRVMAEDAVLNLPETRLGMFLSYGATPPLVAALGLARAKEMILFAEDWDAARCLAAGAVQQVAARGQVGARIDAMIATLRQRHWPAVRLAKQVANAAAPARWGEVTLTEPELAAEALAGGDVAARVEAFLRRHHPER
ncbi:enoyl-CoA hydratase/isomerase family protein [Ottowia sp.]|uniref:enoyl-CoA hydratase/isomerase family protein n=1 Tax=Ottowia sp. TaxID=1898956 RepID=UPI002BA3CF6B|nr:enoyl-CoA hydratase/isomerase family protein [Ottowia sp.]HNR83304.1 enoyl-CoA hydratase/isomerase family protein [Ottowia sp.]